MNNEKHLRDVIAKLQKEAEALEKELQKYKEICEQFQKKYDEAKALDLDAIDPIFLKPIEK